MRCCYLLHDLCVGRFLSGQIIIPILVCGNEPFHRVPLCQLFLHAPAGQMASLVIVEAEQDRIDLRLPLQQLQHRLNGGAAAGHIAVALPALRMERDVGEHIDGSFEHIEAPICADVVEAVAGIAALHIEPEGFAEAVGAALVGMAGDAVFIRTCLLYTSSTTEMNMLYLTMK